MSISITRINLNQWKYSPFIVWTACPRFTKYNLSVDNRSKACRPRSSHGIRNDIMVNCIPFELSFHPSFCSLLFDYPSSQNNCFNQLLKSLLNVRGRECNVIRDQTTWVEANWSWVCLLSFIDLKQESCRILSTVTSSEWFKKHWRQLATSQLM